MAALVHLYRPAVWVSHDEPASPLADLVRLEQIGPERLQRRQGCVERGHPETNEGTPASAPSGTASRRGSRQDGHVHAADLARRVNVTVTVVLVLKWNPKQAIERHGPLEMIGEDDDRRHLTHADTFCHAETMPLLSSRLPPGGATGGSD